MPDKPISPRKLRANRANARNSTGPRTATGKRRASRNALKHGLLASRILAADDPAEDPAEFARLHRDLIADLEPAGALQGLLVERMAVCFWRLQRALRFEAQAIHDRNTDAGDLAAQLIRELAPMAKPSSALALPSRSDLDKLLRYEAMIERELNRVLIQLQRRQSPVSGDPEPPPQPLPANAPAPNGPTAAPPTAKSQRPTANRTPHSRAEVPAGPHEQRIRPVTD